MGLTIHYKLHAPHLRSFDEAHALVARLHDFAAGLHFQECGDIQLIERFDDPMLRTFLSYLKPYKSDDGEESFLEIHPLRVALFAVQQEGSETATFGLSRFADTAADIRDSSITRPSGLGQGYHWSRFCKTQFASLSNAGGWDNFFKIHDGICRILDHARSLGLQIEVHDESEYFTKRDVPALKNEIDRWNQLVAAFTGRLKDRLHKPGAVVSPITDTPEFEHLEHQGQDILGDFDIDEIDLSDQ
ncbi:MAG TPA: hypothetical protein VH253_01535 [Phycisphaerae bacterium]|nr:hypothetical protein [Phycisphaerae bacterium]